MIRKLSVFALSLLLTITSFSRLAFSQGKDAAQDKSAREEKEERRLAAPDQMDDEEDLNRELWEFAKKTPYEDVLRYVARVQRQSQATAMAEAVLPTGWKIAPAGTQTEVGRLPYEAVPFAGRLVVLDTGYYVKGAQEVSVVDADAGRVVKTLNIKSLFPSAEVGLDGDLYISGGYDQKVYRVNRNFDVVREYTLAGYAGGLAAVDAKHIALSYMVANNAQGDYIAGKLALLNTETGKVEQEINVGYFPYAVRYLDGKFYVTILGENRVRVYDAQLKPVTSIEVGERPQAMCVDGQQLYVVNTNSDSLSVINTRTNRLASTISVRRERDRFGSAPTSCATDAQQLYVTLAGMNAVAVINKNSRKQTALIPTGWYPTKVLVNDRQLLVVSAKGVRARRPNPQGPHPVPNKGSNDYYVLTLLKGSVSVIPKDQLKANQASWTREVENGSPMYSPVTGFKLPIRHIFYIIKENRTYDQVLGDLKRGNNDPALTIFGRDISPNHHALAEQFVTLDNFFADGEISVLGHSFTTSGYASPFLEWLGNMSYSSRYKGYPFGTVPAVTSPAYLWDELDARHVDYRIYGENYYIYTRAYRIVTETFGQESELAKRFYDQMMVFSTKGDRGNDFYKFALVYADQGNTPEDALRLLEKPEFAHAFSNYLIGDDSISQAMQKNTTLRRRFAEFLSRYAFNYRSWDLAYSDLDRVRVWRDDFERQLQSGKVVPFEYIWLPNDHTNGANDRLLNAYQYVAQNDAALGRIIETISHSAIWRDSLILIEEDDAQNGPDHVDATRTVALAIGPYVKRGAVVSDRYDQLSMLRTVEVLLGLNPLNLNDRLAAPMFSIFTEQPDLTPYTPTQPSTHLTAEDQKRNQQLGNQR